MQSFAGVMNLEMIIMMGKKLKIALAMGAMAATLLAAGCGGGEKKAESTAKGGIPAVIRVGSETTYPPFEFTENDKYVGFDLDLTDAIIKKMGSKMEFKSMGFDALIPAVQAGQIDIVAAAMNATPERAKTVAFSDPYYTDAGYTIIVKKDNTTIKDWADLAGKKVGAQVGTDQVNVAKEAKAAEVKQLDTNSQGFMELQAGTLDAFVIDKPVGLYYLHKGADKDLKAVGSPKAGEPLALAMNKDKKELVAAVNKALKDLKADGTYDKIYAKWFGEKKK